MLNAQESTILFRENSQKIIETNLSIDELKVPDNFNQDNNMRQNNLISNNNQFDTYNHIQEINYNYPSYNNISTQNYFNPFLGGAIQANNRFNNPNNYIGNQNYLNQIQYQYYEEEKNNIEKKLENLKLKDNPFINGNKAQKNQQISPYYNSNFVNRKINVGNNQRRYDFLYDFFQGQTINHSNPNNCREYNQYTHKRVKSSFLLAYNFTGNILDEQILMNYFRPTYNVQLTSFDYNVKLINPKEIEEKRQK